MNTLLGRVTAVIAILTFCYGIVIGIGGFVMSVKANTNHRIESGEQVTNILLNQTTMLSCFKSMRITDSITSSKQKDIMLDINNIQVILMNNNKEGL